MSKKLLPEMKGLPPRDIKFMRTFTDDLADPQFVQQTVAQFPREMKEAV